MHEPLLTVQTKAKRFSSILLKGKEQTVVMPAEATAGKNERFLIHMNVHVKVIFNGIQGVQKTHRYPHRPSHGIASLSMR